jgi:hypothetical protein
VTLRTGVSGFCQRWREGRASWRHASEGGFDRSRYEVAPIRESDARALVRRHHYAVTTPPMKWQFGLYGGAAFVGAAVLSVPTNSATLTKVFPDLVPLVESIELGRFVLREDVPANAETWFLARVWEMLAREGVRGVVSFSDPVPRCDRRGRLVTPGHVGTIYQASNASYLGRGASKTLLLLPDGTSLEGRSLAKLRGDERSCGSAVRQLVAAGARLPGLGERTSEWVQDVLASVPLRRVKHPGNHRYAFAIGSRRERRAVRIALPAEEYPCPCSACRSAVLAA